MYRARVATSPELSTKVLLAERFVPCVESLVNSLQEMILDLPAVSGITSDENSASFQLGDDVVTITARSGQVAREDLEGPCRAAWYWSDAAEEIAAHRHHVAITLKHGGGHIVERHLLLSLVVRAVLQNATGIAVIWENSDVIHSTDIFLEQTQQMTIEELPLMLWINFVVYREEDGTHSLATRGLTTFALMDLEVRRSERTPDALLELCYSVVNFMIQQGASLPDNAEVTTPDGAALRALYGPCLWDNATMSIHLEWDALCP